ncbi:MAG TPA: chromate efflux transporter [Vicinamibacterales bacterium]
MPAGGAHPLYELAALFLRLGFTAFGGPAAHIALMEAEVVRRRAWMTREEFLDYLAAVNLIPGPNSTELALYVGHSRGGWPGLFVAGAAFIVPAAAMVTAIAWAYVRYRTLPQAAGLLYGVKPVVVAVVAQALWGFGGTTLRSAGRVALAAGAVIAAALGVHELIVLGGAAAIMAAAWLFKRPRRKPVEGVALAIAAVTVQVPFGLPALFLSCLKIGAVLFGSGYVLLALLNAEFVARYGWLTEQQLLDAAAVGLITPGPVFTTATFVGYILGGPVAGVVATIAIFLPAFVLVAASIPLLRRLKRSALAAAVLQGVAIGSVALMSIVAVRLTRAALVDPLTVVIGAASLVALVRYRVNATWLIVAGAAAGLVATVGH